MFIIELVISVIAIPPFIDYKSVDYKKNKYLDYIVMVCFLKLYLLIRIIRELSPIKGVIGRFISSLTKTEYSNSFLFKSWIKEHPITSLIYFASFIIIVPSYILHLSERYTLKKRLR